MSEGWIAAEANSVLDTALAAFPWLQLHTGAPGAAGTSNVATNTTRKDTTGEWGAATGGVATSSAKIGPWTTVPATEVYTKCSFWSAPSGGSCGLTGSITGGSVTVGNDFDIPSGSATATLTVAS
jgi:hypothetical protein